MNDIPTMSNLVPHPRLYIGRDDWARLPAVDGDESQLPYLAEATRQVAQDAARYVEMPPLEFERNAHNAYLTRAREVQERVLTLLTRWKQTGLEDFRSAVLKYIEQIGQWEYWSWITWRAGDPAPDAIYDLSYGENSTTLAIAYDWLYESLSGKEKDLFLGIAGDRSFRSGLKHARPGGATWFGRPDSNWNTVCAGGLGMLALAMYEDAAQARELLPRVEESVAPFFHHLDQTSGAWPEGIGYWNYGMRYGFMYLLSHERATGQAHPLLQLEGVRQTLAFPIDFCPHGQPCSFGDVNRWDPLPFHYRAAVRLGQIGVVRALDAYLEQRSISLWGRWPNAAEWLLLHPGTVVEQDPASRDRRQVKLYQGLDWGILADRAARPQLYMSVRGGTTKVPHGHRDLMSFHCVIGGERLIASLGPAEYLDTTFSPRREEIPEMMPTSKNALLINGVGITTGSSLDCTELVHLAVAQGIRLEATSAMGKMYDGLAATFCGRWVLLLKDGAFLVVDRASLPHVGRVESRMHTFAHGEQQDMRIAYACNVPALFCTATTAPTTPTEPSATVLRWCTRAQHKEITMVTLLCPGVTEAGVNLIEADLTGETSSLTIAVRGPGWQTALTLLQDRGGVPRLA
jgi:hypothetical protein